jgi:hypothetical protein
MRCKAHNLRYSQSILVIFRTLIGIHYSHLSMILHGPATRRRLKLLAASNHIDRLLVHDV